MPPESDSNSIEELKKSLYSRSTPDIRTRRRFRAQPEETDLRKDWERPPENPEEPKLNTEYHDHSMSFFTKILIGAAVFFLVCLGVGAYLFFNGSNLISANNLDVTINGPVSVAGGTPFSFVVAVTNKNNVKLTTVDLEVDFPTGSVDPTNTANEQKIYQVLMDDVNPGGMTERTINADLYGQENSTKEMILKVYYQVPGSNATFEKDKTYDVLISSSPLTLSVSSFNQVTAGQKFDMKVTLTSNSQTTIKNVLLNAVYPFGYSFVSSDQSPLPDKSTWSIGDITPGQSKTITISGTLEGQDQDSRVLWANSENRSMRLYRGSIIYLTQFLIQRSTFNFLAVPLTKLRFLRMAACMIQPAVKSHGTRPTHRLSSRSLLAVPVRSHSP